MSKKPISRQGIENIKQQIEKIMRSERKQIIAEIEEARSHGDLRENAEYHSAKERQGLLEAKLRSLNEILINSEVIDFDPQKADIVQFGAKVTYVDLENDKQYHWQVLGPDESDSAKKTISITSPVGAALIGKQVGDTVIIDAPKGKIEVEILKIDYEK